ncbi:MAG: hypothetical protein FWB98_02880 [Defluviitaleaceae bacterium]|nr:hypothetical protein [Defluviitaleaceae bacterium]
MLKPEFIQSLKQTDVSTDASKTATRLREIWSVLEKSQRDEVLEFVGLKKTSVERAYKTGSISAKLAVSVAQVAKICPRYLTGQNDESALRGDLSGALTNFLKDLGYKATKKDMLSETNSQQTPEVADEELATFVQPSTPDEVIGMDFLEEEYVVTDLGIITMMAEEASALLDENALEKVKDLTCEETSLLLQSLRIQSGFSDYKKAQFELVKYLLLL